jgi:hypothetical protein
MHAAGATGAVVVLADCSSEQRTVAFYGAACIDPPCDVVDSGTDGAADAGTDAKANDANDGH